jgi:hypothetical protein
MWRESLPISFPESVQPLVAPNMTNRINERRPNNKQMHEGSNGSIGFSNNVSGDHRQGEHDAHRAEQTFRSGCTVDSASMCSTEANASSLAFRWLHCKTCSYKIAAWMIDVFNAIVSFEYMHTGVKHVLGAVRG